MLFLPFFLWVSLILGMGRTTVIASLSSAVPVSPQTRHFIFSSVISFFFCSAHGITTVCASTAVRAFALAVPMCTNMTICRRLPLTLAWLLHSKKATDSDVWFYSVYFLCDLLISMLLINRASYKSWHCSPLCCFSLAVLLVSLAFKPLPVLILSKAISANLCSWKICW